MTDDDDCPDWVAAEGQAIWSDTLKELASRDMLARASRVQVATYCQTWAQYAEATQQLNAEGLTAPQFDKDGNESGTAVSPWYKIQQECQARLRAFWSDWRLLPKDVKARADDGHRRGTARLLEGLQLHGTGDADGATGAG
jgi:P27 family predicted phage terminase small subunit